MLRKSILLICVFISMEVTAQNREYTLSKLWTTDPVLKVPESVRYDDARSVLYVSNIEGASNERDGKGFISRLSPSGEILDENWVTGLNAPKGMGVYKNELWVADVDELVVINIEKGSIDRKLKIQGAQFLNDITIDNKGAVYVSDMAGKKIHKVEKGIISTVVEESLERPNGVLWHSGALYILDAGNLKRWQKNGKLETLASGMEASTDGIEHMSGREFIVSCWTGVVYIVNVNGGVQQIMDTRSSKTSSADIGYDSKNRVLYVPTFNGNTVVAYQLN